jgi:hypothetical protein
MGSCALPDLALTTQSSALSRRKQPESDQEVAQQGSGIDFRTSLSSRQMLSPHYGSYGIRYARPETCGPAQNCCHFTDNIGHWTCPMVVHQKFERAARVMYYLFQAGKCYRLRDIVHNQYHRTSPCIYITSCYIDIQLRV